MQWESSLSLGTIVRVTGASNDHDRDIPGRKSTDLDVTKDCYTVLCSFIRILQEFQRVENSTHIVHKILCIFYRLWLLNNFHKHKFHY